MTQAYRKPGDLVDWHVHPGPVIVIVDEGLLTVTSARDCVAREYGPDSVYIEQGPGDDLRVRNKTGETTVIYALFFQVPEDGPLTIFSQSRGVPGSRLRSPRRKRWRTWSPVRRSSSTRRCASGSLPVTQR